MILASHGIIASQIQSFVGLLDLYPSAAAAYSVRKLRTAYTGSAIRVRRSSDNAEQDIGFVSNQLDTSALTTFCSGTNGFVTTWYDQSGNSRDALQATAIRQPQIVSAGSIINVNSKPSIKFDGVDDKLFSNLFSLISQPITLFHVRKYNTDNLQIPIFLSSGTPYGEVYYSGGNFQAFSGSFINSGIPVNLNQGIGYYLANSINSQITVNNNTIVTGDSGTQGMNQVYLGTNAANSFPSSFNGQEIINYPSNKSSNFSGISTNINTYYAIY